MRRSVVLGLVRLWLATAGRRRGKVLVFHLPSIGELQFVEDVLSVWVAKHPRDLIVIAHTHDTRDDLSRLRPDLADRVKHIQEDHLRLGLLPHVDLFVTPAQGAGGLPGVFSIATFHGQPSKGLTFTPHTIRSFDAFFLYGPLHKQALDEYLADNPSVSADHLRIVPVGYPKSDRLVAGAYTRHDELAKLRLDPSRPTVLYAPAFNQGASLQEAGEAIVEELLAEGRLNVIVKLPVDCLGQSSSLATTGGVDWFSKFALREEQDPRFRLFRGLRIDPALAASDVLITCVSSVSFEFLAIGKPVVFIDTPRFFSTYLKARYPSVDTEAWADRVTVNAGRCFGVVVRRVAELCPAVAKVLSAPDQYPPNPRSLREYLLHNPGTATEASIDALEELLRGAHRPAVVRQDHGFFSRVASETARALRRRAGRLVRVGLELLLRRTGWVLQPVGEGYLSAIRTRAEARRAGLSVLDYLEQGDEDPKKRGRRRRIVQSMRALGVLKQGMSVVEIGPGAGPFLELVKDTVDPVRYEVYEADREWARYLRVSHASSLGAALVVQPCNGETLASTATRTVDLVHAHAVFVYLPTLKTLSYIREAARVLKPGGYLVADFLLDGDLGSGAAEAWLASPWRFPVIVPEKLLLAFAAEQGLEVLGRFSELYGATSSTYLALRRR